MTLRDLSLYKRLASYAVKDDVVNRLLVCVEDCFDDAVNRTKSVIKHMPEYTLHDEVHLVRVVEIMGRLIPEPTLERLTALELGGLILSAAYHDIGMAPSDSEVRALLTANASSADEDSRRYVTSKDSFPNLVQRQNRLRKLRKNFEAQEIEGWFLVQHLRRTHAERASRLLLESYLDKMLYDHYKFAPRLADVCFSHNEDASSLTAIDAHELVRGGGEYCNWRFVAAVLRLADILDFEPKRTPAILFEHLGIRDSVSVREWKKHLAITGWDIRPGLIAFSAQCQDPVIEKCIRDFVRMIDNELFGTRTVLEGMHDPDVPDLSKRYALDLPLNVKTNGVRAASGPKGPLYLYQDLSFSLDQERIVDLLMGLNLYQTPTLFLRELLQNAVDACRHRMALHQKKLELGPYDPIVDVKLFHEKSDWYLQVDDNGMGMDDYVVRNFFAKVGRSYYRSADFLQDKTKDALDFAPVSQFGIGILSVFMDGDLLTVETRRFSNTATSLSIEIANQGSLFWFKKGARQIPGTSVRLRLLHHPESLWRDSVGQQETLQTTISRLAPHTKIPITVSLPRSKPVSISEIWDVYGERSYCKKIDVRLDYSKTKGLEGLIRVYILQGFAEKINVEDEDFDPDEFDEDLSDYLKHDWGKITRVFVDKSQKTGETEHGYSTQVQSAGRWSQHGFSVSHPLFGDRAEPRIPFPFPVSYDLNVIPPLAFPLTVDRKAIVVSEEARRLCNSLSETISFAFFQALGKAIVRGKERFFRKLAKDDNEKSQPFLRALDKFLS